MILVLSTCWAESRAPRKGPKGEDAPPKQSLPTLQHLKLMKIAFGDAHVNPRYRCASVVDPILDASHKKLGSRPHF